MSGKVQQSISDNNENGVMEVDIVEKGEEKQEEDFEQKDNQEEEPETVQQVTLRQKPLPATLKHETLPDEILQQGDIKEGKALPETLQDEERVLQVLKKTLSDDSYVQPSPPYLEPQTGPRPTTMYLDIVDLTYDEIKDFQKQMSSNQPELPPARSPVATDNTYVLEGTNGVYLPISAYEHLKHETRRASAASRLLHDNRCVYVTLAIVCVLLVGAVVAVIALAVTRPHTTSDIGSYTGFNCTNNPCQNGGQCVDTDSGFWCNCTDAYQGVLCQIMINRCDSHPCLNGGTCVQSGGSYACNCAANYVGDRCDVLATNSAFAFNAYVTNADYQAQDPVMFSGVSVNIGQGFDTNSNMLTTPRSGLYWIHIHMMTPVAQVDYHMIDVQHPNASSQVGVRRLDTDQSYHDTQSRDDVCWLTAGDQVYMSSTYEYGTTFGVSDLFVAVWSVFILDTLMDPLIAFRVYQMSNVNSLNVTNPFPFTTVSLNEGDAWNSESYQFIAPVGGVYVLSYSTACLGHASSNFDLMIDGKTMYNAQVDDSHRNVDTASRTVPVSLKQGQAAWINGNRLQSVSDIYQMSSFKGFFYSPSHGRNVAWAVHSVKQVYLKSGGTSSVAFEIVGVNVGNVWNANTNQTVITVPGTYYVNLVATQQAGTGVEMYIFINNVMQAIVYKGWGGSTGPVTREAGLLVTLQVGDTVSVRQFSGGRQGYTSFSGFLLYPTN